MLARQFGHWPWGQQPHELDALQVALTSEALTPVHLPRAKDGKRPAKVRKVPRGVLEEIARRQGEGGLAGMGGSDGSAGMGGSGISGGSDGSGGEL